MPGKSSKRDRRIGRPPSNVFPFGIADQTHAAEPSVKPRPRTVMFYVTIFAAVAIAVGFGITFVGSPDSFLSSIGPRPLPI
jgi:hypothetical protein